MRGVVIKKANVIAEDSRRKIVSILNGEIGVRDIHILFMKEGETDEEGYIKEPLGQHYHFYPEVCYCLKGKCKYWLKNRQGEEEQMELNEGELMFRGPGVSHTCLCTEDCILIDGANESWLNDDWNHVHEELI